MARVDRIREPVEFLPPFDRQPRHGRGRHVRRKRFWTIFLVVVVLVVAAASVGAIRARSAYVAASRHILRGVRIGNVDVGGLTRPEAVQKVSGAVKDSLSYSITVRAAGRQWHTSPWDLGVRADVEQAVGQAFAIADSLSWFSRVTHRLRKTPVDRSIQLTFQYPADDAKTLVQRIAGAVYRAPTDASMSLVHGAIVMRHSHAGQALAKVGSVRAIMTALRSNDTGDVSLSLRTVSPDVTETGLGSTITVDLSTNRLRLYDGFHVKRTYPVATAKQGFATPVGTWNVVTKVENPSWTNPDPTGWGAGEPLFIPPGPSNPLGLRAMYLDAPGIRIHGTPDSSSIGTYASHGCIRMLEQDVIALYPLVPVGTKVLIFGAPPWGLGGPTGVPGT